MAQERILLDPSGCGSVTFDRRDGRTSKPRYSGRSARGGFIHAGWLRQRFLLGLKMRRVL